MNTKIFFTLIVALLTCYTVVAQKDTANLPAAFKQLTGCWQGTLNYSGTIIRKPYSTTAELIIRQIDTSYKFRFLHIYTKDTNDKSADTLTISTDGGKINNENITVKRYTPEGNLEIIIESP